MCFIAKIGIEKGASKANGEFWPDKNCLAEAVTPERKGWYAPPPREEDQFFRASEQPITKPEWAS